MSMSISMKKATTKTNLNHNNRNLSEREKERNSHIDYSRSHENNYLIQDDIKKLYEREFSEALENYNEKQTRSDRKIKDYYKHIESSKKTSTQQEMIIQVGDKDDFLEDNELNRSLANNILEEWFEDFEARNPNLKVYNAVIHNDEASPHLHLNFVPVASGYKRGLEKQVAFDRAIKQQDVTLNKTRPFEDWREKEVLLLENKLKERGIERKLVGTNQYKDVNEYKIKKDLEKEIKQLEISLVEKRDKLSVYNEKIPDEIKIDVKRQLKNVEVPTGEKTIFGKNKTTIEKQRTNKLILDENDYKKLISATRDNKKLKGHVSKLLSLDSVQENIRLSKQNKHLKDKNIELIKTFNKNVNDYNKLLEENSSLMDQISDLRRDVSLIYESAKEFLSERTDSLKAFKNVFKDFVEKVKDKTSEFYLIRNETPERNELELIHKKESSREKDRGMEL